MIETIIIGSILYLIVMETFFQVWVKLLFKNKKMDLITFGMLKFGSMVLTGGFLGINYVILTDEGIETFMIVYGMITTLVLVVFANWKYMKSKGKIE